MTSERPYFSIILATWNAESTLAECLQSLSEQTFQDFELIVQDNASDDSTLEILSNFPQLRPQVVSEKDNGIYDAWNRALSRATGEWVYFIGADNRLWSQTTLEKAAALLACLPTACQAAYGRIVRIKETGEFIDVRGLPWPKVSQSFFNYLTAVPHAACFQRLSDIKHYGCFNIAFKIKADSDLLLKSFLNASPAYLDMNIVAHRMGGVSTKLDSQLLSTREALQILVDNHLPTRKIRYKLLASNVLAISTRVIGPKMALRILELFRRRTTGRAAGPDQLFEEAMTPPKPDERKYKIP